MLIGNPHEFAIWLDPVKDWTIQSTVEGLFALCIDGMFLVKQSTLSARAVTLSGESDFWAERLRWISECGHIDTRGRSKDELFIAANEPRYGEDDSIPMEGVDLTPMETLDSHWKVFLFFDASTNEDVVVYGNTDDEENIMLYELRLPYGRIQSIIEDFVEQTKIFDHKELFGLRP